MLLIFELQKKLLLRRKILPQPATTKIAMEVNSVKQLETHFFKSKEKTLIRIRNSIIQSPNYDTTGSNDMTNHDWNRIFSHKRAFFPNKKFKMFPENSRFDHFTTFLATSDTLDLKLELCDQCDEKQKGKIQKKSISENR